MIARTSITILAATTIALGAITAPATAQITTATVSGSVRDTTGGALPGATITLVSETRGTRLADVVTNSNGDFVFPNVTADTYIVQVTMAGFKTLKRSGIKVSPGDRMVMGTLTIEVGALAETVMVTAESPVIQLGSGERSFAVTTESVQNLPISNRSFVQLATIAPGVAGTGTNPARIGGGGANNVMMDGISTMDTGNNGILLQMNVESIAEVKILTSGYQAEYGRSSGLQITAVTKSGTNRFRGSLYDVMRKSNWNVNSKTNTLNGDPKALLNEQDLGYSIGGPVGKPGGQNKLFFFYSHEYAPRTGGGDVQRFRMPTALERQGDFSQTTDNTGAPFPYIKDPLLTGTCSAANQTACFQAGGAVGRIPADRLYQTGLNILKMFPMPNVNIPGAAYNYEITRPAEKLLAWQPAVRIDYQPSAKLRGSFKYSGWQQRNTTINGTIPGFNDTRMYKPILGTYAATVNYTLGSTMFLEATYGHAQNELTGCTLAQSGTGPTFCQSALAMNDISNLNTAGLGNLPFLFPDANVINPGYYAYEALTKVAPPNFQNGRVLMPPSFAWGSRITNTPPNIPFPGYLNINATNDISISLTKVAGRHTVKTGFYNTHSYKAQQRQGWAGTLTFANDTSNPLDSQFGFANAALGVFSSYNQFSKYVEGTFIYNNTEGYIQDNWKVNNKLTLDYGVRLVHQQPQYDSLGQASNFLPDKWAVNQAPVLYLAGCANNVFPCAGANRQALNPLTGQLLGPNTTLAIGTLVPSSGNTTNGLFLSGQGIAKTTYTWPALRFGPRVGVAYDVTGEQRIVVRGGGGLFFDRPDGNSIYPQIQNPPTIRNLTVRYGQLQTLGSGGLTTEAAPALNVFEYAGDLPASTQWSGGVQMALPWASAIDVSYVGQHSFNTLQSVDINGVDFGAAFLPRNQDATLSSATPGAVAVAADQMRTFRGYSSITQQWGRGWRTFHSLQLSFTRRFKDGVSFGLNDTIVLSDHQSTAARLQHNADGTYSLRSDQAQADELLGTFIANRHLLKGNFVWNLPNVHGGSSARHAIGVLANDWQLSGVWTASTPTAYTVGFSYQGGATGNGNQNITGSPTYGGRIRIVGDPGSGCSGDPYRQFNTAAFAGPLSGSVGLESGADYLRGCFNTVIDTAIARNVQLGRGRQIQFRLDLFNTFNQSRVTGRNTTVSLASPIDPTPVNLPFDASGNLIATRSQPKNAGFGVANGYQAPRTVQAQVRFSF
jgi:hypothetical protein